MARGLIMPSRYPAENGPTILTERTAVYVFTGVSSWTFDMNIGTPWEDQLIWLSILWKGNGLSTLTLDGVNALVADANNLSHSPEIANPQETNRRFKVFVRKNFTDTVMTVSLSSNTNFVPCSLVCYRSVGLADTPSQYKTAIQTGNDNTSGVISGITNTDGVVFITGSNFDEVTATNYVVDDDGTNLVSGRILEPFGSDITFSRAGAATIDKMGQAWAVPKAA